MKICNKCKIEKPKNEFDKHSAKKDGLQHQCKICRSEHRAKNAKSISDYQKAYRISRPGERSRQQMRYAARNPEKVARTPEQLAETRRRYKAKNPEKISEQRRNRRALKLSAEGKHTADDVLSIFKSQCGLCANCRTELSTSGHDKYHVDHIMPLALGGSNWPKNLQCLCPKCNMSKGAKHPDIWAKKSPG